MNIYLVVYLSKAKIHQHPSLSPNVIQKIPKTVNGASIAPTNCSRWLYVTMYDPIFVHCGKSLEQRPKVYPDLVMVHRMIEGLLGIS